MICGFRLVESSQGYIDTRLRELVRLRAFLLGSLIINNASRTSATPPGISVLCLSFFVPTPKHKLPVLAEDTM